MSVRELEKEPFNSFPVAAGQRPAGAGAGAGAGSRAGGPRAQLSILSQLLHCVERVEGEQAQKVVGFQFFPSCCRIESLQRHAWNVQ